MRKTFILLLKRSLLTVLALLSLGACSSSSDSAASLSASDKAELSPSSAPGYPKVDSIPVAELLNGFDSFLDRPVAEISAVVFLVNKYEPGLCYGMPGPVPDEIVAGAVAGSPLLADFIRTKFATSSDFQVYVKIRQLLMIKIHLQSEDVYDYYLQDGKCCEIIRLHGSLNVAGAEFLDVSIDKSVINVPC